MSGILGFVVRFHCHQIRLDIGDGQEGGEMGLQVRQQKYRFRHFLVHLADRFYACFDRVDYGFVRWEGPERPFSSPQTFPDSRRHG